MKIKCFFAGHKYGPFHSIRIDPDAQVVDSDNIVYHSNRTCRRCSKLANYSRMVNKDNVMICTGWTSCRKL